LSEQGFDCPKTYVALRLKESAKSLRSALKTT